MALHLSRCGEWKVMTEVKEADLLTLRSRCARLDCRVDFQSPAPPLDDGSPDAPDSQQHLPPRLERCLRGPAVSESPWATHNTISRVVFEPCALDSPLLTAVLDAGQTPCIVSTW
jgi:hypothetical protein